MSNRWMGVLVVRDAHAVFNETQEIGHEVSAFRYSR
jgi:hypothetical protein